MFCFFNFLFVLFEVYCFCFVITIITKIIIIIIIFEYNFRYAHMQIIDIRQLKKIYYFFLKKFERKMFVQIYIIKKFY